MQFRIGLENNVEGRSMSWVLEHPGCFAYGASGQAALDASPQAIRDYAAWVASHNHGEPWFDPGEVNLQLEDTWETFQVNDQYERVAEGYEINAWFLHDWKPLTAEDVARGLKLLSWSRADLIETVSNLGEQALNKKEPGERWDIAGIIRHIGGAEWWYLDRLGLAFPRSEVPAGPFERLEKVRASLEDILPRLVETKQVVGTDAEFWSPRKLLRRAVWHELDHINHIRKLID